MTERSLTKGTVGKRRQYYLGNNTPEGFFSYYNYILGQKEAEKIICIKGGPGTGKSTFMRKIGEELLKEGEDVDFLHCSADSDSLDGIVLKKLKVALVDGTSPHVIDPINPGAVDSIIHLGDFWCEDGIRLNKFEIMNANEKLKGIYEIAYNYLGCAGKLHENISKIMGKTVKTEEAYKKFAQLIGDELAHKEIKPNLGTEKKYFASAITCNGFVNYLNTLIDNCERVYVIEAEMGVDVGKMLEIFAESARYRGFDVEGYYCPMKPGKKLEHVVIPDLKLAVVTSNEFHHIENRRPWFTYRANTGDLSRDDLNFLKDSKELFTVLMKKTREAFGLAKRTHDILESYYIPNMNFLQVETVRNKIIEEQKAKLKQIL
ncbi:MAG: ATPase [Anaerovorax sp.]